MKNRVAIEALIDRLVRIDYFDGQPPLDFKISLLSLLLEELKHERQTPEDVVDFETYLQSEISADQEKILVTAPVFEKQLGTGTASIRLQPPLLMFLLLHHNDQFRVSELVHRFIEKVRPQLSYLDFKKTKSGSIRCAIHTRHAAQALRNYGLVRYTWRQGYKGWELTLAGFIAAAEILHTRSGERAPWTVPPQFKETNFEVRPEIRRAWDEIKSYGAFIARLSSICGPEAAVFKKFEPALLKAYSQMWEYWAVLNDSKLSRKNRRTSSTEHMREIQQAAITDEFYDEFSKCIQVGELKANISLQPRPVDAPREKVA
jgi:hypothetical protein